MVKYNCGRLRYRYVRFRFMIDQDAWNELCDLYLSEQEYAKAAFCMEELILQNPHNHLFHLRFADIKYTQVYCSCY